MIYFITVNYYSTSLIEKLLVSINLASENSASDGKQNHQVLIVNNSPDDTSIKAIGLNSQVTVIEAGKNLGFGVACNLGIQTVYHADPQAVIWLINPDATLDSTAISEIKRCLIQDNSVAILGTRIRDTKGNIWFDRGTFNPWLGSLKHLDQQHFAETQSASDSPSALQGSTTACRWVSGCSFIINLAAFNHCPSFDPHYFLYYEDSDFCERYYQQGYRIAVTDAVLVTHVVSAITQRNQQHKFRYATFSKLYFLSQHGTFLALLLNLIYLLLGAVALLPSDRPSALGRWQGWKTFVNWMVFKPQASP